jgi:hypothetical protein
MLRTPSTPGHTRTPIPILIPNLVPCTEKPSNHPSSSQPHLSIRQRLWTFSPRYLYHSATTSTNTNVECGKQDSLDRLVLDILLVGEKDILNLLLGHFAEVAGVARGAGFVLRVSAAFIPGYLIRAGCGRRRLWLMKMCCLGLATHAPGPSTAERCCTTSAPFRTVSVVV